MKTSNIWSNAAHMCNVQHKECCGLLKHVLKPYNNHSLRQVYISFKIFQIFPQSEQHILKKSHVTIVSKNIIVLCTKSQCQHWHKCYRAVLAFKARLQSSIAESKPSSFMYAWSYTWTQNRTIVHWHWRSRKVMIHHYPYKHWDFLQVFDWREYYVWK